MQQANKSKMIEWGFTRFNRVFLRSHFEKIQLWKDYFQVPNKRTLFLINHSTWWDPLLIFYLNDKIVQSDGYAMMSEYGLKKHPFFRKVGGYSINPNNKRHLVDSLNYSIDLLRNNKTVWIFPQGKEEPLEKRPLEFSSGTAFIAQRCEEINVVPVSLYYSFEDTRKPNAYVTFGSPIDTSSIKDRKQLTTLFEMRATKQLDELREAVTHKNNEVFTVISPNWRRES